MGCGASNTAGHVLEQQPPPGNNYPQTQQQPAYNNNNNVPVKPPPILQPQTQPSAPPMSPQTVDQPPVPQQAINQQAAPVIGPPQQPIETHHMATPIPEVVPAVQNVPMQEDIPKNNDDPEQEITPELLNEFVELEKQIRELESNRSEEKLLLHQIEYENVQEAWKVLQEDYEKLKSNALQEYDDVAKFDLVSYMVQNNIAVVGDSQVQDVDFEKKKQEYEYFEARNKQDIAEKQLRTLEQQLSQIGANIEACRQENEKLANLRLKVDGLLENIFNGEYGSDLEDRLELEAEQLLQYKKHLSMAHYKWWNGRQLLHHACSQIAYAVRRWIQIQEASHTDGNVKYHMITDTRNNIIACHQNLQRAVGYLNTKLPYWSETDDKNIVCSVNIIYNDAKTSVSYSKALQWYRYYHWRLALLVNWMDQVINNKIVADHQRVSRDFRVKYNELRIERLRCIKGKVKSVLGIDLDIEQFSKENEDINEDDELPKVVSDIAINAESFIAEGVQVDLPAVNEAQSDPSHLEAVVKESASAIGISTETATTETGTDSIGISTSATGTDSLNIQTTEMGIGTDSNTMSTAEMAIGTDMETDLLESSLHNAPILRLIPLSELAPPPSDTMLFGNVEELQLMHQKQIEEFDKAQEMNKTRQEQGLQDKLRKRQSKRRKQKLQEEQEAALLSKQDSSSS